MAKTFFFSTDCQTNRLEKVLPEISQNTTNNLDETHIWILAIQSSWSLDLNSEFEPFKQIKILFCCSAQSERGGNSSQILYWVEVRFLSLFIKFIHTKLYCPWLCDCPCLRSCLLTSHYHKQWTVTLPLMSSVMLEQAIVNWTHED